MTNDNYSTDEQIMQLFTGWFDPCVLSDDEELRGFDGLGSSWDDQTFVNPPYSNPLPWVEQAIQEAAKGKTVVMLLKMDTSTRWFKALQEQGAMFLWVNERLRHKTGKPANFPSMIAILRKGENIPERSDNERDIVMIDKQPDDISK